MTTPFDIWSVPIDDEDDSPRSIQKHFDAQHAIGSMLDGEISVPEMLEAVEAQGVDMDAYLGEVCQNMEWYLDGNGILLPG